MGQYYMVVDLDRREYVHPHRLGSGLKLWEICAGNLPRVLAYLLRGSTGRGGGDPRVPYQRFQDEDGDVDWAALDEAIAERFPNEGRWAGDRVVIVGDYDESEAFGGLYREVQDSGDWTEISAEVAAEFNRFIEFEDMRVDEPVHPTECDHEDVARTVDRQGVVVHERCRTCHLTRVDRRGEGS